MYLGLLVCKTYIQQENLKSYKLTMPLKIAEVLQTPAVWMICCLQDFHPRDNDKIS